MNLDQPVVNILLILKIILIWDLLTYFLHHTMQQQAKIKQQRMAAPIAVIALWVDIPPASPASSNNISKSKSASSSIFVAAAMI